MVRLSPGGKGCGWGGGGGLEKVGGKAAKNQTGEELNQMRYATIKIFQILTTNGKTVPGGEGVRMGWGGGLEKVGGKSAKNQTGEELNQMRYATIKIFQILTTNGKTVPGGEGVRMGWGGAGEGGGQGRQEPNRGGAQPDEIRHYQNIPDTHYQW